MAQLLPRTAGLLVTAWLVSASPALAGSAQPDHSGDVLTEDGAVHGDRWLVIFAHSGRFSQGFREHLEKFGAPTELVRLKSSWYADLNPGHQLVISGSFDSEAAARAHAGRLTAAGVSWYIRHAGAYVGDPAVPEPAAERAAGPAALRPAFMVIATGATQKAEAQAQLVDYRERGWPRHDDYPVLVESATIAGLNPGFFIVVAAVPEDEAVATTLVSFLRELGVSAYHRSVQVERPEALRLAVVERSTSTFSSYGRDGSLLGTPEDEPVARLAVSQACPEPAGDVRDRYAYHQKHCPESRTLRGVSVTAQGGRAILPYTVDESLDGRIYLEYPREFEAPTHCSGLFDGRDHRVGGTAEQPIYTGDTRVYHELGADLVLRIEEAVWSCTEGGD